MFCFPYAAVLKKVQQCGIPPLPSFAELFPIQDNDSTPFTNAPSKFTVGRGSSKAAISAHMELRSSFYNKKGGLYQKRSYDLKRSVALDFLSTFICLATRGKPDAESKRFAHLPEQKVNNFNKKKT